MRRWGLAAALLADIAAQPCLALEPVLGQGEELEARIDGDLDGDGNADIAYLARTEEKRELIVNLTNGGSESLELDTIPLGSGELSIKRGVLLFEDLTGGTTAVGSTYRYRFDDKSLRMRLIGLDATLYSRTYAHDGFELSWNLLNGDLITRKLQLNKGGGDAAYDPIIETKRKKRSGPVWLAQSPDPEALISELSGV
ncbi:hypothetical protein [Altererythrobacter sp. Root672]|uniref:hypothetical protein n=1 Tax=Altererythrobacter sp. Root672 TaxID=1736584 RepID=UPI000AF35384|nr:hypothetical protein [Altererythrobacter sp. Root672]